MRRWLAAGLALVVLTTAAVAESPVSSPVPHPRPSTGASAAMPELPTTARRLRPLQRPGGVRLTFDALADGPVRSPRPKWRPAAALRPEMVVQVAAFPHSLPETATVAPPMRPENLRRRSQSRTVADRMPAPPQPEASDMRGSVCGVAAIKGAELGPVRSRVRGCGIDEAVKITAVAGLPLSVPATVDCPTARALNAWAGKALIPDVGRLGGGVARIDVMGSYECRPRNNQRGAKVSEHGSGRAVDIGGFTLKNGTTISVLKGWGSAQHGKLMRRLHRAACGPFGTVLGPAANSFHRNHFHFDTARYRSGSYCE